MTDREQLIELRKSILTERMQGMDQTVIDRATKNLERMAFNDHADFMSYVDETAGFETSAVPKATEEELDAIADSLGFGASIIKSSKEPAADPLEEVFKLLRI